MLNEQTDESALALKCPCWKMYLAAFLKNGKYAMGLGQGQGFFLTGSGTTHCQHLRKLGQRELDSVPSRYSTFSDKRPALSSLVPHGLFYLIGQLWPLPYPTLCLLSAHNLFP